MATVNYNEQTLVEVMGALKSCDYEVDYSESTNNLSFKNEDTADNKYVALAVRNGKVGAVVNGTEFNSKQLRDLIKEIYSVVDDLELIEMTHERNAKQ